jgi:hypothetical protein
LGTYAQLFTPPVADSKRLPLKKIEYILDHSSTDF